MNATQGRIKAAMGLGKEHSHRHRSAGIAGNPVCVESALVGDVQCECAAVVLAVCVSLCSRLSSAAVDLLLVVESKKYNDGGEVR